MRNMTNQLTLARRCKYSFCSRSAGRTGPAAFLLRCLILRLYFGQKFSLQQNVFAQKPILVGMDSWQGWADFLVTHSIRKEVISSQKEIPFAWCRDNQVGNGGVSKHSFPL